MKSHGLDDSGTKLAAPRPTNRHSTATWMQWIGHWKEPQPRDNRVVGYNDLPYTPPLVWK